MTSGDVFQIGNYCMCLKNEDDFLLRFINRYFFPKVIAYLQSW